MVNILNYHVFLMTAVRAFQDIIIMTINKGDTNTLLLPFTSLLNIFLML